MEDKFIRSMYREGYFDVKVIEGLGYCGLQRFAFTVGLVVGLNRIGYDGRYCFQHLADAKEAFKNWDGKDDPSGPWIKYKGERGEYSNPNYEKEY